MAKWMIIRRFVTPEKLSKGPDWICQPLTSIDRHEYTLVNDETKLNVLHKVLSAAKHHIVSIETTWPEIHKKLNCRNSPFYQKEEKGFMCRFCSIHETMAKKECAPYFKPDFCLILKNYWSLRIWNMIVAHFKNAQNVDQRCFLWYYDCAFIVIEPDHETGMEFLAAKHISMTMRQFYWNESL